MVLLKAIEAGVDVVDTCLSPLGSGTSQPATESLVATLKGTEYVVYVLLSSRTVMLLATMILGQELFVNMIGDMTKYFYTSQLYSIRSAFLQNGTWDTSTMCAALSVYVVLPVVISVFSFEKKELKF